MAFGSKVETVTFPLTEDAWLSPNINLDVPEFVLGAAENESVGITAKTWAILLLSS